MIIEDGPVRIHARGQNHGGRPDLVPYLKTLTQAELGAYCSGVLSAWAALNPREALEFAHHVATSKAAKPAKVKRQRALPAPVHCTRCGVVIPRTGQRGRPVTRHKTCPISQQKAA